MGFGVVPAKPVDEGMAQNSETIIGSAGAIEHRLDGGELSGALVGVVCHPHPRYGGTMDNKVVFALSKALNDAGAPAVRFNFRGVGASEGRYDEGRGELDDCLTVLRWVASRWPDRRPVLAGFSFGAWVALRAAATTRVHGLVTVAPPVGYFGSATSVAVSCPWLLIQGEADEVVDADQVLAWARALPEAPSVIRYPQTGHFFHGQISRLRADVSEFLAAIG